MIRSSGQRLPAAGPLRPARATVLAAFLLAAASAAPGQPSRLATLTSDGSALLAEGRLEAALDRFQEALRLMPGNPALEFNVGLALFRMGRFNESLGPLQRAAEHPPSAAQARFLRGTVLYQREQLLDAARELELARSHPELGAQALYMLVEIYRRNDEAERAQAAFLDLQRRYPASAFYHKLMGAAYEAEGMLAEAMREFEAALQRDASMPEVPFAIGFIHFKRREHEDAANWLQKELALQPCHAKSHHYLGEIDVAAGRVRDAEARYRRAIQCDERQAAPFAGLGALLLKQGRHEEAVGLLQAAIALDPDSADAHYSLGRALLRLGRKQEAEAALRRVNEIHAARHEKAKRAVGGSGRSP